MSFWKWFSTKFHAHEWEVLEKNPLVIQDIYNPNLKGMGTRYVLQCKVCGELKQKDIK